MTDVGTDVAEPVRRRASSRCRVAVAAAAVVVVAASLVTFLTMRHLDGRYGPIVGGNSEGPYTLRYIVTGKDGLSMRLSSSPGASAQFFELLDNDGAHSVQITSIPTDDIVTDIRWSIYRTTVTRTNSGDNEPWHRLPANVPAHGQIRLLVTIHRPTFCRNNSDRSAAPTDYTGRHVVHWESLLHDHASTIEFPADYGIQVC